MTFYKTLGLIGLFALFTTPAFAQDSAPQDHVMDHSKMSHDDHNHDHGDAAHTSENAPDNALPTQAAALADTPLITAKVNGLVCDFCTQTLKKVFKKEPAVKNFDVDLDAGEIRIVLHEGQNIDNKQLEKLIRKSGYSHVSTQRTGGA